MHNESSPSLKIQIEVIGHTTVNFALQQNDVPIVRELILTNQGGESLEDLKLTITSEPAFTIPFSLQLAELTPGDPYPIHAPKLVLSPAYLAEVKERTSGLLRFEISKGNETLSSQIHKIELLAADEWGGLQTLPEILAAFVLPNSTGISEILSSAADLLGTWTESTALSGYQSKSRKRVLKTMAAIYTAIQSKDIRYISPPASFESGGQKIRLPESILQTRLGTCLDLTLFLAGCLEQAGLNPLISFTEGHCFVGVWLDEDSFPETATDELSRLLNRVQLDEIALIESTMLCNGGSFEDAVKAADRCLEDPEKFRCVVDVSRCRRARIRPLPLKTKDGVSKADADAGNGNQEDLDPTDSNVVVDLESLVDEAVDEPDARGVGEPPEERLARWKRKLLDLSLNNRLLNFRETRKTLPLLCASVGDLEDGLADGVSFNILSRPRELGSRDVRDAVTLELRTGDTLATSFLAEEFESKRLRADLSEGELDRHLLDIYRASRSSIEETGSNVLYLALGFLNWFESDTSDVQRRAPLILIPLSIDRASVREGFRLRRSGEESSINVTLLELLKQEHGLTITGLDPLPEDDHGIDVKKILQRFRKAIKDIDRWTVEETACVGLFSFAKFLMWRDLEVRTEELRANPIVAHLVDRQTAVPEFSDESTFPDPNALDETHHPKETFTPLSADSSQMAAIYAAADEKTFVLEGPPGTGKSQSITNMIAHALASGKTVLFVSEKMAALDVVHRRLSQCGLEPFTLELHSNKASKQEVLQQFNSALHAAGQRGSKEWGEIADRLHALRSDLNVYVDALHKPRLTGESYFDGLGRLMGHQAIDAPSLEWPDPQLTDRATLLALRELVNKVRVAIESTGPLASAHWKASALSTWSPAAERAIFELIGKLGDQIDQFEKSFEPLTRALQIEGISQSREKLLLQVPQLAQLIAQSKRAPAALLTDPEWERSRAWIAKGRKRDNFRGEVFADYSEDVKTVDVSSWHAEHRAAESAWGPFGWFKKRALLKKISGSRSGSTKPSFDLLPADFDNIKALQVAEEEVASKKDEATNLLGTYWNGGEADWEALESLLDHIAKLRAAVGDVAGLDLSLLSSLREKIGQLISEADTLLGSDGPVGSMMVEFTEVAGELEKTLADLDVALVLDSSTAWGELGAEGAMDTIRTTAGCWGEHRHDLKTWIHWQSVRAEAIASNLEKLVEHLEEHPVPAAGISAIFDKAYYTGWCEAILEGEPTLRDFFSPDHARKIEEFQKLDDEFRRLTKDEIIARLAAGVPAIGGRALPDSEMGLLRKEIQKRSRHLPIRNLISRIPNLLPLLKPCILMSPLSVAQYLDAGHPPFDLVVFDEASQMPPWDAIGALARGRNAVIVGDPKQLPPTTFFQRGGDDESVEEEAIDLESILDESISAFFPQRQLLWHYRSRHESLIAFSNHQYYENKLLTFPSPDIDPAVTRIDVPDGCYDKGRSRTNKAEASRVVAEIVARLKDPVRKHQSIGVVTFSTAQQILIENLLDEARRSNPEIEPYFTQEVSEAVFVKNLESVQGDERDIILFSICYGPDATGKISMNFGPLNREGGERRLNVAITRARLQVLVVSTLRSEQIDLTRSRARGVQDLRYFLEYAEHGPRALANQIRPGGSGDFESPFEAQVASVLRDRGHRIHPQVGCSGYRIDLGVVHPDQPGTYLIGIECDGANYHSAKIARDRDKLRQAVLEGLGWRIHRVWSSDWWTHPEAEIEKIEAAIEMALQSPDSGQLAMVAANGALGSDPPSKNDETSDTQNDELTQLPDAPETVHPSYTPYQPAGALGDSETFYLPETRSLILKTLEAIVDAEGPISDRLAASRLVALWRMGRVGKAILSIIEQLVAHSSITVVSHGDRRFYWPASRDPATWDEFRVAGEDEDSTRSAPDLPPEEVANAAQYLLTLHISLPLDTLVTETSRLLGYGRTGTKLKKYVEEGITFLQTQGGADT